MDMASPPPRRVSMPEPEQPPKDLNVWNLLKDMVGSKNSILDLPLPAEIHLPLSELEKQVEEAEFSCLLDKAAGCPAGSLERMVHVVAFSVSAYSSCQRTKRSLNPLLSETFEFVYPERGLRSIAEHVSRLPAVVAQCIEGRRWVLETECEPHLSLGFGFIDLNMNFFLQATFEDGEIYSWTKVRAAIQNLIMGATYIEHVGVYRVVNHTTGLTAVMELCKPRLITLSAKARKDGLHQVKGHLERDGKKLEHPTFHGKWSEALYLCTADKKEQELWRVIPVPPDNRWGLTSFVVSATEMTPGLRELLPPTDSRLRADVQALERARYEEANAAKRELEERNAAYLASVKESRADKAAIAPHWFELVAPGTPLGQGLRWRFRRAESYWDVRQEGDWSRCPDIFGLKAVPSEE